MRLDLLWDFEVYLRFLNEDVDKVIKYVGLELREEV